MPISDLFKPKIKHSDPVERMEALDDVTNQHKLVSIVLNDTDANVKLKALSRIDELPSFKKILLTGKKQSSVSGRIIDAAFGEMKKKGHLKTFFHETAGSNKLIDYLKYADNEEIILAIITQSKNKNIRKACFDKMADMNLPPEDTAGKIFAAGKGGSSVQFINYADKKYNNEDILKKLCYKTENPELITVLANLIDDIDFLEELKKGKKSKKIKKAIDKKILPLKPDYLEFKVQMDCPECGHPVMVNGPVRKIECSTCSSIINLGGKFWKKRFRLSLDSGVFISGKRISDEPGKPKLPRCHKCGEKLPVKQVPDGSMELVTCEKCGTQHSSYPAPDWMKKYRNENNKKPVHIFCGRKEDEHEEELLDEAKPVAFNCINCSGSLEFNIETPRIMDCGYCGTKQYLPNSLWHALHPVVKIKPWYVLFKK